jgi:hypothetical protein
MTSLRKLLDDRLATLEQHLAARLANPSPGDRFWFELQAKEICDVMLAWSDQSHAVSRLSELRLRFAEVASEDQVALAQKAVEFVRSDPIAVR